MEKSGKKLINELPLSDSSKGLVGNRDVRPDKWVFSFLYFRQIELFGVDECNPEWFVSVFERLKDLSNKTQNFAANTMDKQNYRFHPIDWDKKNVPIKRRDLSWIPKEYLDNESEFPLWQFSISKGKGRIVGFLNEDSTVFYIVFLIQSIIYNLLKIIIIK
ncbi:hypothetical protein Barb7_01130 [Bacteroidales bacterium Barb7]|nr:hypothetical protein Barb7_01130 [Bacteroidales bacterium Barb7]